MDNPFVTKGYAGAEYFCDRVNETKQLVELTSNGNNMALISPRRVGKTDLIHHLFEQPEVKNKFHTFQLTYFQLQVCETLSMCSVVLFLTNRNPRGRWYGRIS